MIPVESFAAGHCISLRIVGFLCSRSYKIITTKSGYADRSPELTEGFFRQPVGGVQPLPNRFQHLRESFIIESVGLPRGFRGRAPAPPRDQDELEIGCGGTRAELVLSPAVSGWLRSAKFGRETEAIALGGGWRWSARRQRPVGRSRGPGGASRWGRKCLSLRKCACSGGCCQ